MNEQIEIIKDRHGCEYPVTRYDDEHYFDVDTGELYRVVHEITHFATGNDCQLETVVFDNGDERMVFDIAVGKTSEQATRFTYQGQDYVITADGWRGYELHQNGAGPEYVERTDHVMRMWRYWLDGQNYQEQEDGPGLW